MPGALQQSLGTRTYYSLATTLGGWPHRFAGADIKFRCWFTCMAG